MKLQENNRLIDENDSNINKLTNHESLKRIWMIKKKLIWNWKKRKKKKEKKEIK